MFYRKHRVHLFPFYFFVPPESQALQVFSVKFILVFSEAGISVFLVLLTLLSLLNRFNCKVLKCSITIFVGFFRTITLQVTDFFFLLHVEKCYCFSEAVFHFIFLQIH